MNKRIVDDPFIKMTEIVEFVEKERERSGWAIKRLAYHAGVDRETVIKTEANQKGAAPLLTVLKLLDALGYTVEIVPKGQQTTGRMKMWTD